MKEKIGIIGYGFVGSALDKGFNRNVEKCLIDPKLNTNISDLKEFDPSFIFICLPTPMNDNGSQDCSIIYDVIDELSIRLPSKIIIIKSTVLPNHLDDLSKIYPNIVYNPEFLREKHADIDFKKTNNLILGGPSKVLKKIVDLYRNHSVCEIDDSKIFYMDLKSASLIKYSINSFLASKVIFFNQLKLIFEDLECEIEWGDFIKAISSDSRMGNTHMDVPGNDGKLGFGGACFPKDISALYDLSKYLKLEFSLLREAILINEQIRNSLLDNLEDREREQNINFNTLHRE
tara:strand:- start:61 stop:927 length:867 start_codon:yes stop_codon:yes gene_type:complete